MRCVPVERSPESQPVTGGCVCGAVRFRLETAPHDPGVCACRRCRADGQSDVAAVPLAHFRVTSGEAERRRSSFIGERWFCAACETELAVLADYQPDMIEVARDTLDRPEWRGLRLIRGGLVANA